MKRTSNQAELNTPSTVKRPLSAFSSVQSTPSAALSSLRADLQASASASAYQRQLTSSQRQNESLLREIGAIQERVKNLEKERAILLSQQEKSLSQDSERENRNEAERKELAASAKKYREWYSALQEEHEDLKSTVNGAKHQATMTAQESLSLKKQMEVLQEDLEKVDEENQILKNDREELKQAKELIQELRSKAVEKSTATVSNEASGHNQLSSSTSDVLRKELHHQVAHLRTLEHSNSRLTREIAALRNERANTELLKEEKLGLETKLRRMDSLRKKLAEKESEVTALKREKDEWAAFLQSPTSSSSNAETLEREKFCSPAHLTKTLASTRIELFSLQDKLGNTTAQLKSRDGIIEEFESRVKELEEQIIPQQTEENQKLKDKVSSMERGQALDLKELEMLREQLVCDIFAALPPVR